MEVLKDGEFKTYVAEKPKLGRAIAAVLSKWSPQVESGREFIAGKSWAVCWSAGHSYSLEEPDHYIASKFPSAPKGKNGKFKWSFDHLPLLPGMDDWPQWSLFADKDKASLLKSIKKWIGKASVVVNAGDPDREGQLLIDEILQELGNKKPVRRVLISAFDPVTVEKGLIGERDNDEFLGLSQAGRARSCADWLCGMNFSRAATLQAQANGYAGSVVSIGRVQTPLLGLIVQRDLEIANFKPVDYFALTAKMSSVSGPKGDFTAKWRPHAGQAGLDEDGRLLDRKVADQLNALVKGQTGKVIDYSDEEKQEGPPLPFSIDKLQVMASKKYGYTSDKVLEAIQSLYQDHDLVTYPRSDKSHLPVSQLADAPDVVDAVKHNLSFEPAVISNLDVTRKSRAWDDKKSTPHHGIIPTRTKANLSALSPIQRNLYDEICRRYLCQFLPNRRFRAVSALIDVAGQNFAASGTTTIAPGWRVIYGASAEEEDGAEKGDEGIVLPPMKQGDAVQCNGLLIEAKKTTPPKHFTDGSLLEAMVNVHKFVTDERVKSIFMKMLANNKGTGGGDEAEGACGLGTPATRHTFVPKLIDNGFAKREAAKGKSKETFIISTPTGQAFIQAIPTELGKPDMTALWETAMGEIEAGTATLDRFLGMQANWIRKTIEKICATPLKLPDPPGAKPRPGNGAGGAPRQPSEPAGKDCPKCGKPMMKRPGTKGPFLGCSGYPQCKHSENIEG
jgi:DNA topoisomerase-3